MSFALLWSKTLDSSVWRKESKETRLVWVTMLMMKNQDGLIQSSVIGLADRARVTKEECLEALRIFLAADPDDTSKVEEGKKIREVAGGWQIVNNELYRFSTAERREFWRQAKEAQRAKKAAEKAGRQKRATSRGGGLRERLAASGEAPMPWDQPLDGEGGCKSSSSG